MLDLTLLAAYIDSSEVSARAAECSALALLLLFLFVFSGFSLGLSVDLNGASSTGQRSRHAVVVFAVDLLHG